MYHQRDCRDDNEHHHRDRIQEDTHIEMQIAQWQPCEVIRNDSGEGAISCTVSRKIGESRQVREHGNQS